MNTGYQAHGPDDEIQDIGDVKKFDKILNDPRVLRRLAQPFKLSTAFDIPYLGGYSIDGTVIYVDRHFPAYLLIEKKQIPVRKFLITHERVEKALMDALGWAYEAAHHCALVAEHNRVRLSGVPQGPYEMALHPYIKDDSDEQIKRVPLDLDLVPYVGDKAVMRRILKCQETQQAGV